VSQRCIGEFFDQISAGYRFAQGKYIRGEQFKDVLNGRKTCLRARSVVFRDQLSFVKNIDRFDPTTQAVRSIQLRKVVAYWATLKQKNINQHIPKIEAQTLSRMVVQMLQKTLTGELPSLGDIDSEYNTIASELSWSFRDRGDKGDPFLNAIRFMGEHALDVPAIAIECAGLEALAEQYAIDNVHKRKVEKSQLDHDSYDLSAIANFVPYCDAGIFDGNAVTISRRAYKKLRLPARSIFSFREIDQFTDYLISLPAAEQEIDLKAEAKKCHGRTLFVVPRRKDKLIRRELLTPLGPIKREILPLGGLKVWSKQKVGWADLLKTLESAVHESELNNEMIMYGAESGDVLFEVRVPFEMFDLCREEIATAFEKS
jgi:hypothetical protein